MINFLNCKYYYIRVTQRKKVNLKILAILIVLQEISYDNFLLSHSPKRRSSLNLLEEAVP